MAQGELLEAIEGVENEVAQAREAKEKHRQRLIVAALVAAGAFLLCRALDYRFAMVLIVVPVFWPLYELLEWDQAHAALVKAEKAVAEAHARLQGYLQGKEGAAPDGD